MKYKSLVIFSVFVASAFINPNNLFAGAFPPENTPDGEKFEIALGEGSTLPAFEFQPSPQVKMVGLTSDSAFSVAAAHASVYGKDNAEAYAMTSEASGLYTKKGVADEDAVLVGGTAGLLAADYVLPDGADYTTAP